MIGIVFVTVIAWIPGHAASYFGEGSSIKGGQTRLETFKQIVRAPSVGRTGLALDFKGFSNGHVSSSPVHLTEPRNKNPDLAGAAGHLQADLAPSFGRTERTRAPLQGFSNGHMSSPHQSSLTEKDLPADRFV